jgi:hypothetical protein
MQIKLFYKALPDGQDPALILAELEQEVNEWLEKMGKDIFTLQSTVTPPNINIGNGFATITLSY